MKHQTRWTARKIGTRLEIIEPLVYRRRKPLPPFRYTTLNSPLENPPVGPDVDDGAWEIVKPGMYWGAPFTDFAMRTTFEAPAEWAGAPVALYLPLGEAGDFSHPETLAYIDGAPYAAADRHHQEIRLPVQWRDGKTHTLALHGWTGLMEWTTDTKLLMRPCALVQIDQPTRDFIVLARIALGVAEALEDDSGPAKSLLLNALDEAFKILDTREPLGEDAFYASVPAAYEALKAGIAQAGPPMDVDIVSAGHAHIDVAWLWTLGQTRRKSGRTFHTAIRLMEQFPDYCFTQSQAQLYRYLEGDYPELFEAIKARVAEGRWEPTGGTWVEMDCNVTGAESLARQFLLGAGYFNRHFGPDAMSPVLWLPDVFGYAWSLPQLIKEAGLKYFFTIKIGWNLYNRLPYDSFWWQGLDGTRILTHFSTTNYPGSQFVGNYNATATPAEIHETWRRFQQKEAQQTLLMSYGYGDGGGGPTREMLENIRAMTNFPATPRVQCGKVGDFFRRMEEEAGASLPTWNGELYLEIHRGTYTTQSRNKRANRKSEFALHDAEFVAALASVLDPDYAYPAETFQKAWELVCLNQFHDIIPGSSITPVYVESLQQYGEVQRMATEARDAALEVIAARVPGDVLLVNPTSFCREDLVFWPGEVPGDKHLERADGRPVLAQATDGGVWIAPRALAPLSVTPLALKDGGALPADAGLTVTPTLLENDCIRVELNAAGDITRIYDKVAKREALPEGAIANQFQAFEDRPINWDAWDIDLFYDDKMWLAEPASSVEVVEAGPLHGAIEIKRRILHSEYTQRVALSFTGARLDFDTKIDWRERKVLLKVAFPVDVLSPVATYEIQWGSVQRPTHTNTSWDWARFETAAQKWVDLSEGGYGVSLLNDCKYGHDIHGNVMRISLLRGTTSPDPQADQGEHRFAYSLLPHNGEWGAETVAAAYALNDPIIAVDGRGAGEPSAAADPALDGLVTADRDNIVIETVKRAEDGEGIIVRFYESRRMRGPVTLTAGFDVAKAWRANLLEVNQEELEVESATVTLHVKPYQIVTVRLLPA
ncbi:MAG: alpha-mannosidase [Anaerolineae bacterium]|nr:alpha-mannosidase [Anaerolineae bacterium]